MSKLFAFVREGSWGTSGFLGIIAFVAIIVAYSFAAIAKAVRTNASARKLASLVVMVALTIGLWALALRLQPVVEAKSEAPARTWFTATANMPSAPLATRIAMLVGFGPGDCLADGQEGEHFDGRGDSGDFRPYCYIEQAIAAITATPKGDEDVPTSTPTPTITMTVPVTVTETATVPVTPVVTDEATTTPEIPTETVTPTPEIPTSTPSTPEPTERANCGVGNGVDGDTPGCENGRNDGVGTGPGNPGSAGGNGNNNH